MIAKRLLARVLETVAGWMFETAGYLFDVAFRMAPEARPLTPEAADRILLNVLTRIGQEPIRPAALLTADETLMSGAFKADELERVNVPGPCPLCERPTVKSDRGGYLCPDEDSTCWRGGDAAIAALALRRQAS